jgi:hypothetical protein
MRPKLNQAFRLWVIGRWDDGEEIVRCWRARRPRVEVDDEADGESVEVAVCWKG